MNDFCYNHDVLYSSAFPLEHHHDQQLQPALSNSWTVQIHTTDMQPASGRGSFRRNNNHEEIKSEHIKSENESTNVAKDRANSIPTPPTRSGSTTNEVHKRNVVEEKAPSAKTTTSLNTFPDIFKCNKCPFLSLSPSGLELHITEIHDKQTIYGNNLIQLKCPGCDNIFYMTNSLLTHLREDHLLCLEDSQKLLDAVQTSSGDNTGNMYNTNVDNNSSITTITEVVRSESNTNDLENLPITSTNEVQRNGRIFLKNVNCLREPPIEPTEQTKNHITASGSMLYDNVCENIMNVLNDGGVNNELMVPVEENNAASNLHSEENLLLNSIPVSKPKQKISIKSVDVLREPTLLRRDYELLNFPSFTNSTKDLNLSPINSNEQYNAYNNTDNAKANVMSILCTSNKNLCNPTNLTSFEQPRKPKIYIKNVDILKESIDTNYLLNEVDKASRAFKYNFPTENISDGGNTFLNSGENFNSITPTFDICNLPIGGNLPTDQYLFENTNNLLPNVGEVEDLSLANGTVNSFQLLDDLRFNSPLECELATTITPTVTEPTPSPPASAVTVNCLNDFETPSITQTRNSISVPKQKIFIKNVDVLKAPQFQGTRRTLHLRTVDELNLMNKNEVENLIAPNLENTSEEPSPYCKISQNILNGGDSNFKLHDFDMNDASGWSTDYDLGEELDCIITETIGPIANLSNSNNINSNECSSLSPLLQKASQDVMAMISIPNIDQNTLNTECNVVQDTNTHHHQSPIHSDVITSIETFDEHFAIAESNDTFINNASKATNVEMPVVSLAIEESVSVEKSYSNEKEPPPLAPVTSNNEHAPEIQITTASNKMSIPVPPLVPVSPLIPIRNQQSPEVINSSKTLAANEKGRIYVAHNLLQLNSKTIEKTPKRAVSPLSGGTSLRGRPFGSKCSNNSKPNKKLGSAAEIDNELKCTVHGCAFRFQKSVSLEYHKRCHGARNLTEIVCPDCNSSPFTNWNTLHTHLWRVHQIDMELYSCKLCSFKTPIYSRLVNTHAKIHSDERNYKCDQCTKAFKNTKQLKNHRRWHRIHGRTEENAADAVKVYRCDDCGSAFSHRKSLREHSCKESTIKAPIKCDTCDRIVSSKSALKLHQLTHDQTKRFKCAFCSYTANDHNAFRRHKMTHNNTDNQKFYSCPHCSYKSIQSVSYQKHVQQKHPELIDTIIHKCETCSFSTINRGLLIVHQVKHENSVNTLNQPMAAILETNTVDINLPNEKDQG